MKKIFGLICCLLFIISFSSIAFGLETAPKRENSLEWEVSLAYPFYWKSASTFANYVREKTNLALGAGLAYKMPFVMENWSARVGTTYYFPSPYGTQNASGRQPNLQLTFLDYGVEYEKNGGRLGAGFTLPLSWTDSEEDIPLRSNFAIYAYIVKPDFFAGRSVGVNFRLLGAYTTYGVGHLDGSQTLESKSGQLAMLGIVIN